MEKKRTAGGIGRDILDAIRKAHPYDTVEKPIGFDESYLKSVYEKLEKALSEIDGTELGYERDADGNESCPALSGAATLSRWDDWHYSYHLFFVGLAEDRFRYLCDTLEPAEDGEERRVEGTGMIGCTVAVSLLAPYALVKLRSLERYSETSQTTPELDHPVYSLEGEPIEMQSHFRETMGDEAVEALKSLSSRIARILDSVGIRLLAEDVEEKPVGRLTAAEEVLAGPKVTGKPITVREAFFFQSL